MKKIILSLVCLVALSSMLFCDDNLSNSPGNVAVCVKLRGNYVDDASVRVQGTIHYTVNGQVSSAPVDVSGETGTNGRWSHDFTPAGASFVKFTNTTIKVNFNGNIMNKNFNNNVYIVTTYNLNPNAFQ